MIKRILIIITQIMATIGTIGSPSVNAPQEPYITLEFPNDDTKGGPIKYNLPLRLAVTSELLRDLLQNFGYVNEKGEIINDAKFDKSISPLSASDVSMAEVDAQLAFKTFELTDLILNNKELDDSEERQEEVPQLEKDFFLKLTNNNTNLGPLFAMLVFADKMGLLLNEKKVDDADSLRISQVVSHTGRYIASLIKGKSAEEMRKTFEIPAEKLHLFAGMVGGQ